MSKVKQLPQRSKSNRPIAGISPVSARPMRPGKPRSKNGKPKSAAIEKFAGKLGDSAKTLAECLEFDIDFDRAGERLGTYAFLKTTEDTANSAYQRMIGRYATPPAAPARRPASFRPEIMAIPAAKMKKFLAAKELAPHRITLGTAAALQAAHALDRRRKTAGDAGRDGRNRQPRLPPAHRCRSEIRHVKNEKGEQVELSNATFSHVPALAQAHRPQERRSISTTRSSRRTRTRWPPRSPARCSAMCITPRPAATPARWRRRCFTTTCRSRFTTT